MDPGHTASRFQTTSWTLIVRARDNPVDLETLLKQYWSPVYAYLMRKVRHSHDAEDLTQAFLSQVFQDLIQRADQTRGRFRSFLKSALDHFVIDEHRRVHGRDGTRPKTFLPDDPKLLEAAMPSETDDPATAFDRQWYTAMLDRAISTVEAACRSTGKQRQWAAYEARELRPKLNGCEPTPYEELMKTLGAPDPQKIYTMVDTVKRKVRREFREVVAETVDDPDEVDAELDELLRLLER